MSALLKSQSDFAHSVARLIEKAFSMGYSVTLGEAYRDPRATWGSKKSFHNKRLAIDINLFDKNGKYLTDTKDHAKLGAWWQSIGGTWGGTFGDGNHYSWGE